MRVARLERQAYPSNYISSEIKHILKGNGIQYKLTRDGSRVFADKSTLIEALVLLGLSSTEALIVANKGTSWDMPIEILGAEFNVHLPSMETHGYTLEPRLSV